MYSDESQIQYVQHIHTVMFICTRFVSCDDCACFDLIVLILCKSLTRDERTAN